MKEMKKFLALALVLAMVFSMFPVSAFAAEGEEGYDESIIYEAAEEPEATADDTAGEAAAGEVSDEAQQEQPAEAEEIMPEEPADSDAPAEEPAEESAPEEEEDEAEVPVEDGEEQPAEDEKLPGDTDIDESVEEEEELNGSEPVYVSFSAAVEFSTKVCSADGSFMQPVGENTYLLYPGVYFYNAYAEGYFSIRNGSFTVEEGSEDYVVFVGFESMETGFGYITEPDGQRVYFYGDEFADEESSDDGLNEVFAAASELYYYDDIAELAGDSFDMYKSLYYGVYISTVLGTGAYDTENATQSDYPYFVLNYKFPKSGGETLSSIYNYLSAYWERHTGACDEGDYISHGTVVGCHVELDRNNSYIDSSDSSNIIYCYSIKFTPYNCETPEIEAVIADAAEELAEELGLYDSRLSEFEKVNAINEYLRNNVNYDPAYTSDHTVNDHNAYGPLISQLAVCQGFSLAFYRLALIAGIDCRLITSSSMNHAWVIVKLGGRWYYCDPTWDSNYREYSGWTEPVFFLKGCTSWLNPASGNAHVLGDEYTTTNYENTFDPSCYVVSEADYTGASVSYDANGGYYAPGKQISSGTAIVISDEIPLMPAHAFVCWREKGSSPEKLYYAGDLYLGSGSLELEAVWEECASELRIICQPELTEQPVINQTVVLSIVADGDELEYQWQYSKNGGTTWTNFSKTSKPTADKENFSIKLTSTYNGYLIRCRVKDASGKKLFSDSVAIELLPKVKITGQPVDIVAPVGTELRYTVAAEGTGVSYQWQYSKDGGTTWWSCSTTNKTAKNATYVITAQANYDGRLYRCKVSDIVGNYAYSVASGYFMGDPAAITSQPVDVYAAERSNVSFSVTASGVDLGYRWQYSKNGGETWTNISIENNDTAHDPTLVCKVYASYVGRLFRCVVTDIGGNSVISEPAMYCGAACITITSQPVDAVGIYGKTISYNVSAISPGTLSYLWQWSSNGGTKWTNFNSDNNKSAATETLKLTANSTYESRIFRCRVTDSYGNTEYTDSVGFTRAEITIVSQPESVFSYIGNEISFAVEAEGYGLGYHWQYSEDNGTTWTYFNADENASAAQARFVIAQVSADYEAYSIRCRIKDSFGQMAYTDIVGFTAYEELVITKQPEDSELSVYAGDTAETGIVANGENVVYAWQYSMDNGENWTDFDASVIESAATDSLSFEASLEQDGMLIRCMVTDDSHRVLYSDTVAVSVSTFVPAAISSFTDELVSSEGAEYTFEIGYEGSGAIVTVESSSDCESWEEIGTAENGSFTMTASADDNGKYFRAKVTDAREGTACSEPVCAMIVPEALGSGTYEGGCDWILASDGCMYVFGSGEIGAVNEIKRTYADFDREEYVTLNPEAELDAQSITSMWIGGKVTSIGECAFAGTSISEAVIPSNVVSIAKNAFSMSSSLQSITLNEGLEYIGEFAFVDADVEGLYIPDSAEPEKYAFYGCIVRQVSIGANTGELDEDFYPSLDSIVLSENNEFYTFKNGLLRSADGKKLYRSINEGGMIIPDGVETICPLAFVQNNITSVVIPESVTVIGESAFDGCVKLEYAVLPSGVTQLDNAFGFCMALKHIFFRGTQAQWDAIEIADDHPYDMILGITPHIGMSWHDYVDFRCSVCGEYDTDRFDPAEAVKSFSVVSSTLNAGNTQVIKLVLNDYEGIAGCKIRFSGLEELTGEHLSLGGSADPNDFTMLYPCVYNSEAGLHQIEYIKIILQSGTELCFYGIGAGETYTDASEQEKIPGDFAKLAFTIKSTTFPITVPMGSSATLTMSEGGSAVISGYGKLEAAAQRYSSILAAVKSVTMEQSFSSIGDYVFMGWFALESITIPDCISSIGNAAFYSCSSLTEVNLPLYLESMGGLVFNYCDKLELVSFANKAPSASMAGYAPLGDLTVSASYPFGCGWTDEQKTALGPNANWIESDPTVDGTAYVLVDNDRCTISADGTLVIKTDVPDITASVSDGTTVYSGANDWQYYPIKNVTTGCESIGENAFYGLSELKTVTFGEELNSLGSGVFAGCDSLESLRFEGDCPELSGTVVNASSTVKIYYNPGCSGWDDESISEHFTGSCVFVPVADFNGLRLTTAKPAYTSVDAPDTFEFNFSTNAMCEFSVSGLTVAEITGASVIDCSKATYSFTNIENGVFTAKINIGEKDTSGNYLMPGRYAIISVTLKDASGNERTFHTPYSSLYTSCAAEDRIEGGEYNSSFMLANSNSGKRAGELGDNSYWVLDRSTGIMTVTGFGAVSKVINISRTLKKEVKTIEILGTITTVCDNAFAELPELVEVRVDSGVVSLGSNVFAQCEKLETLELGEGLVSIGESIIGETAVTSLRIPDSATDVDPGILALSNVEELYIGAGVIAINSCDMVCVTSIALSEDNSVYTLSAGVLFSADMSTLVRYTPAAGSEYTAPESCTVIGEYAFTEAELDSLVLPDGITEIGEGAFVSCTFGSLTLNNYEELLVAGFNIDPGEYLINGSIVEINIPEEEIEP